MTRTSGGGKEKVDEEKEKKIEELKSRKLPTAMLNILNLLNLQGWLVDTQGRLGGMETQGFTSLRVLQNVSN